MPKPDLLDDARERAALLIPREQLERIVVEMREQWGGKEYYISKAPGTPKIIADRERPKK